MEEMKLSMQEIARMIDLSAVQAENDELYIRHLIEKAIEYNCIAVFTLPSWIPFAKKLLDPRTDILLGGAVGFPSGGTTTTMKVSETIELIGMGCREIDVVINIGKLRSGYLHEVYDDIQAVVDASEGIPVKVILECHHLSEIDIRHGCDISINAGAAWVKTGTGWPLTGATADNINLIHNHVGDRIKIKASGGIRDLDTLINLYNLGARRFGLGLNSALNIFEQIRTSLPIESG